MLKGGTEYQTLYLARALMGEGFDVKVLCYHESDMEVVNEFQTTGAEVDLLNWPRKTNKLHLISDFIRYFRKEKPWAVHVQYIAPAATVILSAKLAGIKNILATLHQMGTQYGMKDRMLMRFSSSLCRRFTFVSLAVQESWTGKRHLYDPGQPASFLSAKGTIYNTVDADEILGIRELADKPGLVNLWGLKGKIVVGAVSRLRYEKGIDVLVRAFVLIQPEIPDARLFIVGDGPERKSLENLAERLGISNSIIWTGEVTRSTAIQLMSVMSLMVLPSRYEGFGLTAIEAMIQGIPVVASKTGGIEEVVGSVDYDSLFKTEDHEDLAKVILDFLRMHKENWNATAVIEMTKNLFNFPVYSKTIAMLYNSLI
ncbi:MAG: glycosyltransferase family 4 protein [Bacteroidetes bacterium]|nr:glycosyltransferase family 4 protein [Bacteroidota bacterium]